MNANNNDVTRKTPDSDQIFKEIGLGAQEQANLAWSLTVLEKYDSSPNSISLLQHILQSAGTDNYDNNKSIRLEHAHQLWQAYYLLEEDCPDAVQYVPKKFSDYLKEQWKMEKSRHKTSSARHTSLSKTLDFMGVAHYNEHDEDIDVAIVLKTESSWTHTAEKGNEYNYHHKVAVE